MSGATMQATYYRFTAVSSNSKTGPIPVTTTSSHTCSDACPLKVDPETGESGGCYAAEGPLGIVWKQTDQGRYSGDLSALASKIAALEPGTLWRHNQAGDLPGIGDQIDSVALGEIVVANSGKRGFTYTHKPLTAANLAAIREANAAGFTINLSANNLGHADTLAATGLPTTVVLPSDVQGNVAVATPEGRRVVVCPATYRDEVTCKSCGLCQVRDRKVIVGFPAHGSRKTAASAIARG